jgi:hypothetical protein
VSRVQYQVPVVVQHGPVCWLASAAMIMQFKLHATPTARSLGIPAAPPASSTQSIAPVEDPDFRTGLTWRGWDDWTNAQVDSHLRSLGFVVTRSTSIRDRFTHAPAAAPNAELIYRILHEHGPFMLNHFVGSFSYGLAACQYESPNNAHVVVITGIDTVAGIVRFNNSWAPHGQLNMPTSISSIVNAIRRYEAAGEPAIAYM